MLSNSLRMIMIDWNMLGL